MSLTDEGSIDALEHVLNDIRGISQVGQHEAGEGEIVQSDQGFGQTLVIAGLASEPGGPAEAALDHPAPGNSTNPRFASGSLTTSSTV